MGPGNGAAWAGEEWADTALDLVEGFSGGPASFFADPGALGAARALGASGVEGDLRDLHAEIARRLGGGPLAAVAPTSRAGLDWAEVLQGLALRLPTRASAIERACPAPGPAYLRSRSAPPPGQEGWVDPNVVDLVLRQLLTLEELVASGAHPEEVLGTAFVLVLMREARAQRQRLALPGIPSVGDPSVPALLRAASRFPGWGTYLEAARDLCPPGAPSRGEHHRGESRREGPRRGQGPAR